MRRELGLSSPAPSCCAPTRTGRWTDDGRASAEGFRRTPSPGARQRNGFSRVAVRHMVTTEPGGLGVFLIFLHFFDLPQVDYHANCDATVGGVGTTVRWGSPGQKSADEVPCGFF